MPRSVSGVSLPVVVLAAAESHRLLHSSMVNVTTVLFAVSIQPDYHAS